MKFTCAVEINAPITKVVELFDNTDNLKEWQQGFVSHEHVSGTPGAVGAKSKLTYNTGKRIIELTETITAKNLHSEMTALYEHSHMVNTMSNRFSPVSQHKTKMETIIEYTKFYGFMPKLMSILTPGTFKKQTQQWLENFKAFVEKK